MRLREIEKLLSSRLREPLPGAAAHVKLVPQPPREGWEPGVVPGTARPAAALALIYPDDNGVLRLPLTLRTSTLPHHAGQISLPGGGVDAGETIEDAALREAHEEIGVDASRVRVLGRLTPVHVLVSNFGLNPVLAVTDVRPDFSAHAPEVERILEIDVEKLCDTSCLEMGARMRDGKTVNYPYFNLDEGQVWGATAMVLAEVGELLRIVPELLVVAAAAAACGYEPPPPPPPNPEIKPAPLARGNWTITRRYTVNRVMVVEVEYADRERAMEIAESIVQPVAQGYEEVLVYVRPPDRSTTRRVQWTKGKGYRVMDY